MTGRTSCPLTSVTACALVPVPQLGNGMGDHGGNTHRRRIDLGFGMPPALIQDLSRTSHRIFLQQLRPKTASRMNVNRAVARLLSFSMPLANGCAGASDVPRPQRRFGVPLSEQHALPPRAAISAKRGAVGRSRSAKRVVAHTSFPRCSGASMKVTATMSGQRMPGVVVSVETSIAEPCGDLCKRPAPALDSRSQVGFQ